jgi:hypothetical protein
VVQPRLTGHGPTLFAGLSKLIDLTFVSRLEFGSGRGRDAVCAETVVGCCSSEPGTRRRLITARLRQVRPCTNRQVRRMGSRLCVRPSLIMRKEAGSCPTTQ